MNENLFAVAVDSDEINDFFLGEGRYFSVNRETHEHAYYAQDKGWGEKYISENPGEHALIFVGGFLDFLKTSKAVGNLKSVLDGVLAIVSIFERNGRLLCGIKDDVEDALCDGLRGYFSCFDGSNAIIDLYRSRVSEIGCSKLADAMKVGFVDADKKL